MTFNAIGRRDVRLSLEAMEGERGLANYILSNVLRRNGSPTGSPTLLRDDIRLASLFFDSSRRCLSL